MTQFQHAGHQRGLTALLIQHRHKVLTPPRGLTVGINKQPRSGLGLGARAVVNRRLAGTALYAFATA